MKKTKIVATLGPASDDISVIKSLLKAGMNVARLNFSHGTHEEHLNRIKNIRKASSETNIPVAIMLDTKGPEIRIGKFENGSIRLESGDIFCLTTKDVIGNKAYVNVSYKDILTDVKVGTRILIDDGLLEFSVIGINKTDVVMRSINGGVLSDRKGVNIPDVMINLPAITESDKSDILFGIENDVDYIAASFIRKREDVLEIRKILEENGGHDISIISKIENREGVTNMDEILQISDGIMIARGDLGVEILPEEIPHVQKELIRKCILKGKISITATQMLDSMTRNKRPTRAEVMDVSNAILDGSSAVMLSGETAAGKYPVLALEMMTRIAVETENSEEYKEAIRNKNLSYDLSITNSVANAANSLAKDCNAKAIVSLTKSGFTARAISKFRPAVDIVAITTSEKVRRKLLLDWGVTPISIKESSSVSECFQRGLKNLMGTVLNEGDVVILTAGIPIGKTGSTNMLKVEVLRKMLAKGMGIGEGLVTARAVVANTEEELLNSFEDGDIIVTIGMERDMVSFVDRAGGIVTEEGGLTSSGAIIGLNMRKPTIVGASEITKLIKTGDIITIDINTGEIFKGEVNNE